MKRLLSILLLLAWASGATAQPLPYPPTRHPYLVSASNASAGWKRLATYHCDGTNDQVEIQQAIDDAAAAGGGTVQLSPGNFTLGPNSTSTLVSDTDGGLRNHPGDVDACALDLVTAAEHDAIVVGDVISISGGDGAGAVTTLESVYADGLYLVTAVTGGGMTATEVKLAGKIATTFTGVSFARPRYAIKLPPLVSLEGAGKMATIVTLAANSNCTAVWVTSPLVSSGAQELRRLSLRGDSANQNGSALINNGVFAAAYDVHIRDCEIRYFKGTGLVTAQSWGFQMSGAWIEDCTTGVAGAGHFQSVKIQQVSDAAVRAIAAAYFEDCELRTSVGATKVVQLRGAGAGSRFTGGVIQAAVGGDSCVEYGYMDGAYGKGPIFNGVSFEYTATTTIFTLTSAYLYGGQIRGTFSSNAVPTAVVNDVGLWIGADIDISGGYYTYPPPADAYIKSIPILNGSGASLEVGRAYKWKTGAGATDITTIAAVNDPAFAGVNQGVATPNTSKGYLVSAGCGKIYVDGTAAIVVGDLLSVRDPALYPGSLKKAVSGDTAVARALEAKASGQGVILGYIIQPRRLP